MEGLRSESFRIVLEGMTGWRVKIPSARGNKSACVSESRRLVLEGMTGWSLKVSKAFGTFRRKRFPATLSGICGGDDELERADSERARKQIRMRKGFPSSPRGKKKGPRRESVETLNLEGMTGIEPA